MKRLLSLAAVCFLACSPLLAYDFMVDGLCYDINPDGKTVSVIYQSKNQDEPPSYPWISGDLDIPSSVTHSDKTYDVTVIGNGSFYYCEGLTSVKIPNTVTKIGSEAFYHCTNLKSITIPSSLEEIGMAAFYSCSQLNSISIPSTVTEIGQQAFDNTPWYDNIPDGLLYLGKVAFRYRGVMPENTNITIDDGICSIGVNCFRDCSGLTSIAFPNSVKKIDMCAFKGCSHLRSATIPNSVTDICYAAFNMCSDMTDLTIGESVSFIDTDAFYGCNNLASVNWNATNCISAPDIFVFLDRLTTFVFGDNVESIPLGLCSCMPAIASITLPKSITTIGDGAFFQCKGLKSVTNLADDPQDIDKRHVFDDVDIAKCVLKVPHNSLEKYRNAPVWKDFLIEDLGGVDGIEADETAKDVEGYYDLRGVRFPSRPTAAGIYILRHSDGSSRKVIIR